MGEELFTTYTGTAPDWWHELYQLLPESIRSIVLPSPRWLDNMRTIASQMVGDVDVPYNHQWTDRTPIVFPWKNMVLYGMGPLLGLTAWSGWVFAAVQIFRRRHGLRLVIGFHLLGHLAVHLLQAVHILLQSENPFHDPADIPLPHQSKQESADFMSHGR